MKFDLHACCQYDSLIHLLLPLLLLITVIARQVEEMQTAKERAAREFDQAMRVKDRANNELTVRDVSVLILCADVC